MTGWNGNTADKTLTPVSKPNRHFNFCKALIYAVIALIAIVLSVITFDYISSSNTDSCEIPLRQTVELSENDEVKNLAKPTVTERRDFAYVPQAVTALNIEATNDTISQALPPAITNGAEAVFNNVADQLISLAVNMEEGEMPPLPLPDDIENEFKQSLLKPIVILESDSDEIRDMKQRVINARAAIKEMLSEGKTVRQILEEHQEQFNFGTKIRNEVRQELLEIVNTGDIDAATKYQRTVNLALQQMGIEGIEMPASRHKSNQRTYDRLQNSHYTTEGE